MADQRESLGENMKRMSESGIGKKKKRNKYYFYGRENKIYYYYYYYYYFRILNIFNTHTGGEGRRFKIWVIVHNYRWMCTVAE